MTNHFNGLTPAKAERIAMLMEEAGEVVQICGKILRHGLDNYDPITKITNSVNLHKEMLDFITISNIIIRYDLQCEQYSDTEIKTTWTEKLKYTHHQVINDKNNQLTNKSDKSNNKAIEIIAKLLSKLNDCNPDVGMGYSYSHFVDEAEKLLLGK